MQNILVNPALNEDELNLQSQFAKISMRLSDVVI